MSGACSTHKGAGPLFLWFTIVVEFLSPFTSVACRRFGSVYSSRHTERRSESRSQILHRATPKWGRCHELCRIRTCCHLSQYLSGPHTAQAP